MPEVGFYLEAELSEYLNKRHENAKEAMEFIGAASWPMLYMMWERDFYRDKLLVCYEENG